MRLCRRGSYQRLQGGRAGGRVAEDAAAFSKPALSKCLTKSVAARLDFLHASVQTRPVGGGKGGRDE